MRNVIWLLGVVLVCVGCAGIRMENVGQAQPELVLEDYFSGTLTAYGMIKDRRGRITSTFKAELVGSWDAQGVGTLDEVFVYDDGSIQKRSWTFTPNGTDHFNIQQPTILRHRLRHGAARNVQYPRRAKSCMIAHWTSHALLSQTCSVGYSLPFPSVIAFASLKPVSASLRLLDIGYLIHKLHPASPSHPRADAWNPGCLTCIIFIDPAAVAWYVCLISRRSS
jgi:hypothetical protein